MKTAFYARSNVEINSNVRTKKLRRTSEDSNFLEGSFSNKDNARAFIQLEEKENASIINNNFSSRTSPSIFTSIAQKLIEQSNETT